MKRKPGRYAVRVGTHWMEADYDGHEYTCAMGPIDEVGPELDGSCWLTRLKAHWQAEALDRLKALLRDTHMDKAPTVSRASMHVDDAINRVKQECAPLKLRHQAEEESR